MSPNFWWQHAARLGYAWRQLKRCPGALDSSSEIPYDLHAELLQRLGQRLRPRGDAKCPADNLALAREDVYAAAERLASLAKRSAPTPATSAEKPRPVIISLDELIPIPIIPRGHKRSSSGAVLRLPAIDEVSTTCGSSDSEAGGGPYWDPDEEDRDSFSDCVWWGPRFVDASAQTVAPDPPEDGDANPRVSGTPAPSTPGYNAPGNV